MKAFKLLFLGLFVLLLLFGLNPAFAVSLQPQKAQTSLISDFFKNILQSFKNGFVSQPKKQDAAYWRKNSFRGIHFQSKNKYKKRGRIFRFGKDNQFAAE